MRRERDNRRVTLDFNLTFMQTPGSESDPPAHIGRYFYKHATIPKGRVTAKLSLVPVELSI